MVVWIRWYFEKHSQLREMAERLRTQVEVDGFGWLPLIEGGILLTLILAGATVIFIFWNKQHRLNQNAARLCVQCHARAQIAGRLDSARTGNDGAADLSEEKRREFIAMMLDDTERLSILIDRILGAARIEKRRGKYRFETVSMRHFVEETLAEDRHLYEKDGHVIVLEEGSDARVAIDRSAMRVVLANLLENAAPILRADSTIRLRLHKGFTKLPNRCHRQRRWNSGEGSQECFQDVLGEALKNRPHACGEPAWDFISCTIL